MHLTLYQSTAAFLLRRWRKELQYELVENVLRAEDFIQLKAAVGMLDRPLDQVEKALRNGLFHVSCYDKIC